LIVEPAWQCNQADTPGTKEGYWTFGKLAAKLHMTINSFYPARLSTEQIEYFCRRQPSQIARDGLDSNTAYVFSTVNQVVSLSLGSHYCRLVDDVVLCTADTGRQGIEPSLLSTVPITPTDVSVSFVPGSEGGKLLGSGWSIPESLGRWSDGAEAVLILRFADASRAPIFVYRLRHSSCPDTTNGLKFLPMAMPLRGGASPRRTPRKCRFIFPRHMCAPTAW
jgi:hypothetical protein